MAKNTDKTVALLQLLGSMGGGGESGLHIVEVKTSEPDPITFVMQGTKLALGLDIFEVPVSCYPLREGARLLAFPLAGGEGGSNRWAILAKLNGGVVMATMQGADSLKPDGMTATYGAAQLIIPPFFAVADDYSKFTDPDGPSSDEYLKRGNIAPLAAGDRVSIAPTWDTEAEEVKYVILNRY